MIGSPTLLTQSTIMKNTSKTKRGCLIVLIGPTAVGKTSLSLELAKSFQADIFSSDSRQFYTEMSIGTAKPTEMELSQAKHHFINNQSIREDYNASDYEKEIIPALDSYFKTNEYGILCGGSGLYIDAVCAGFDQEVPSADAKLREELQAGFDVHGIGYLQDKLKEIDPAYYPQIDSSNGKRLMRAIEICLLTQKSNLEIRQGKAQKRDFQIIKIGLERDRYELYQRINQRVDEMLEMGLLDEAKRLYQFKDSNALNTVGYKELFKHLSGEWDLDFAIEKIKVNSRRYAKRQVTWFRRDSDITWFHPRQKLELIAYIRNRR